VEDTPAPTPTLDTSFFGDYEGNANLVPAGSPKLCTCVVTPVPGCTYFVAQMYRGQIAIFEMLGITGISDPPFQIWGYPNTLGNFDFTLTGNPASLGFTPSGNVPIYQSGSGGIAYDFAMIVFGVQNAALNLAGNLTFGKVTVYAGTGSAGSTTVTGGGRTFTIANGGTTNVILVQIDPVTPGNAPLLVVLSTYTTGTDTGDGWTLEYNPPNNTPAGPGGDFLSFALSQQDGLSVPPGAAYELMSYATATLTGANAYTMPAGSGFTLRRGVFGMGPADHDTDTRFAFLGGWMSTQNLPGVFRGALDPSWIGKLLYFKFVPFNLFGGQPGDLADSVAYPYTPVGLAGGVFDTGSGTAGGGTQGNPNQTQYTITGGALTNSTPTSIEMAQAVANFGTASATYTPRFPVVDSTVTTSQFMICQTGDYTPR
jgi:hypothetical protein